MKRLIQISIVILTFVTMGMAQDPGWPRQKSSPAGILVYYQPQVDDWANYKDLKFRMAFSLTPTGGKQVVGVVDIEAQTEVSVDDRTVSINNLTITGTHFPSLDAPTANQMDQLVRTFLPPGNSVTIALYRLVACVKKSQSTTSVPVRNDPPLIFVSNQPALLVQVDGQPVLGQIQSTKLQFVVNTNWPLFFDQSSSSYYLFTGKQWLTSGRLNDAWLITSTLP